ncbi:hypothetical protein B0F90DRAFT_908375 [Multifurca ochricompacta]|uniref:Uncharacterized protein n=1 Tax=Multifurca ochricompacta TaxID=376703 RepID=A0AAD4QGE8_9AGAM|nr:hypothetical protein B0F90DRAFT_908375 [Multifurca ochricompacta]
MLHFLSESVLFHWMVKGTLRSVSKFDIQMHFLDCNMTSVIFGIKLFEKRGIVRMIAPNMLASLTVSDISTSLYIKAQTWMLSQLVIIKTVYPRILCATPKNIAPVQLLTPPTLRPPLSHITMTPFPPLSPLLAHLILIYHPRVSRIQNKSMHA